MRGPDTGFLVFSGGTLYETDDQLSYSLNTVTVTDPKARWKTFTMDAFGNPTGVAEPNPASGTFTTTYAYDVLNRLTNVSMPRPTGTQTRTFVHNAQQRLESATNPENGTVSYTYNADGTMATKTDAKGLRSDYTYTAGQQLQSECKFQGAIAAGLSELYLWRSDVWRGASGHGLLRRVGRHDDGDVRVYAVRGG